MKRSRIAIFIAACCCFHALALAQDFKGKTKIITVEPPEGTLPVGETLTYSVQWLGIPSGHVTMTVEGIEKIDGRDYYHVVCKGMPNKFFRMFYDTEYRLESYIDTKEFYSRRFKKERYFDGTRLSWETEYDQVNHKAQYTSRSPKGKIKITTLLSKQKTTISDSVATFDIPPETHDLLSTFYYGRLHPLEEKKEYKININYGRDNTPLAIKTGKPFWKDVRKKGTFPVFELFLDSKLIPDILGKRKISVYLTADSRRIPLLFSLQTNIGAIEGILQNAPKQ